MRTEQRWSLFSAFILAALIVALNAAPYPLHELWGKVWYLLAWSAFGLLLWVAFDGNRLLASLRLRQRAQ